MLLRVTHTVAFLSLRVFSFFLQSVVDDVSLWANLFPQFALTCLAKWTGERPSHLELSEICALTKRTCLWPFLLTICVILLDTFPANCGWVTHAAEMTHKNTFDNSILVSLIQSESNYSTIQGKTFSTWALHSDLGQYLMITRAAAELLCINWSLKVLQETKNR